MLYGRLDMCEHELNEVYEKWMQIEQTRFLRSTNGPFGRMH